MNSWKRTINLCGVMGDDQLLSQKGSGIEKITLFGDGNDR